MIWNGLSSLRKPSVQVSVLARKKTAAYRSYSVVNSCDSIGIRDPGHPKRIFKIALFADRHLFFKNSMFDLQTEDFEFTPFLASLKLLANADLLRYSVPSRVDPHCIAKCFGFGSAGLQEREYT